MAPKAFSFFDDDGNAGLFEKEVEEPEPESFATVKKSLLAEVAKFKAEALASVKPEPYVKLDYKALEKKIVESLAIPPSFLASDVGKSWGLVAAPLPSFFYTPEEVHGYVTSVLEQAGILYAAVDVKMPSALTQVDVLLKSSEPCSSAVIEQQLAVLLSHSSLAGQCAVTVSKALPLLTAPTPHGPPSMFEMLWFAQPEKMSQPPPQFVDALWKEVQSATKQMEEENVDKAVKAKLAAGGAFIAKLFQIAKLQKEVLDSPWAKHVPKALLLCPLCGAPEGALHKDECPYPAVYAEGYPGPSISQYLDKPLYVCLDCNTEFSTKEAVKSHHAGICPKWKCSSCGTMFAAMPAPMKKVFGANPLCSQCVASGKKP